MRIDTRAIDIHRPLRRYSSSIVETPRICYRSRVGYRSSRNAD